MPLLQYSNKLGVTLLSSLSASSIFIQFKTDKIVLSDENDKKKTKQKVVPKFRQKKNVRKC